MKKRKIVIALGGNALGKNVEEQQEAVEHTAKVIVDLEQQGYDLIITHGNGPQVGMIQNAMSELTRSNPEKYIPCPLSVCVAMSQGYIGYDLQNALREEMLDRGINTGCTTILTQVEVDANDPAFENPTKPIGAFMTKEEADKLVKEKGYKVVVTTVLLLLRSRSPSSRSTPSAAWSRMIMSLLHVAAAVSRYS